MSTSLLRHAAERASADPFFLGHRLRATAMARGWSDGELAAYLGLAVADLPRAQLCGQPRADRWRQDVERIAQHVGANAERLAELLRT